VSRLGGKEEGRRNNLIGAQKKIFVFRDSRRRLVPESPDREMPYQKGEILGSTSFTWVKHEKESCQPDGQVLGQ